MKFDTQKIKDYVAITQNKKLIKLVNDELENLACQYALLCAEYEQYKKEVAQCNIKATQK